jgi:ferredoxin
MKIRVDSAKCTGHGVCESFAPGVFEIADDGDLILKCEVVPDGVVDDVRRAVDSCPTLALWVED